MAIAGGLGLEIDVRDVPVAEPDLADATRLFAESPTRFLVEVTPEDAPALEERGTLTARQAGEAVRARVAPNTSRG